MNLIAITGPTASGKTGLAIEIAQWLGCDIISCDSRQMYRLMDIGTAKPSAAELAKVKHHFINNLNIADYYNASTFEFETLDLLETLFKKNNYAVMVGGSGLYFDAVCRGIDDLPTIDAQVRTDTAQIYKSEGIEGLRMRLKKCDPQYYASVDLNNPNRILKGIEVFIMTGKPYSSFLTSKTKKRSFNIIKIGLTRNRDELYSIIDKRVDAMVEQGLINEAKMLEPHKHLNALNTVGYKELFEAFEGKQTIADAIALIKQNTRKYAKRQVTYFRRDNDIKWFEPESNDKIKEHIQNPHQT